VDDYDSDDRLPPVPKRPPGALDLDWVLLTMLPVWAVAICVFLWRTAMGAPEAGPRPMTAMDLLHVLGGIGTAALGLLLAAGAILYVVARLRR